MVIRKQYSKEFKLDAISLVLDQGYTIAEAARSLEIRASVSRSAYYDYVRRQASYFDNLCHIKLIDTICNIAESSHL